MNNHMPSSVDITHPKSLMELLDLKPSKTSQTGWELGLSKVKEWLTVKNQCKQPVQIQAIQPSSTLDLLNCRFLQMCSIRSEKSGLKLSQNLIAKLIKLSVIFKSHARTSPPKWSQLDSKWAITSSKLTQNSTFTKATKVNATSWFINADCQGRTRTSSW